MPMISPSSRYELLTSYNNFMRTIPSNSLLAKGISALAKDIGWGAACVIHGSDEYSKAGASSIINALYADELELLGVKSFVNGANDMRLQTDN